MADSAKVHVDGGQIPDTPNIKAKKPEPCVLVIFGITGDLAKRKLIPALYHLALSGSLPDDFAVVGFSRSAKDPVALRERLSSQIEKFSRTKSVVPEVWKNLIERLDCVAGNTNDADAFTRLKAKLGEMDEKFNTKGNRLYYLSVAPSLFPGILTQLENADLLSPPDATQEWTRVIVEKPFGFDRESAHELNSLVGGVLDESQTYRIDHYLGKETVQNILTLRFANTIFEPLWNNKYIDHIQVTAAEGLEVSGRGAFYDQTGVGRDIIQNHLLQILALILMEPPVSLDGDHVRDQKVQAIRSLRAVGLDNAAFGQYEGYQQVEGVKEGSRTPTYLAIKANSDNWRWNGVDIYMRAGKALEGRDTEVAIFFKPVPDYLFGGGLKQNVLVLQIQPNEGISLHFSSKVPGEDLNIGYVDMDMKYARAFERKPGDAYERLLLDGMRGDSTLFARRDEIDEAWKWIDPILKGWEAADTPIPVYKTGSTGPESGADLIEADGRSWRTIE
jgi:glucose-6-phosphate 1-dehydrogenase